MSTDEFEFGKYNLSLNENPSTLFFHHNEVLLYLPLNKGRITLPQNLDESKLVEFMKAEKTQEIFKKQNIISSEL